jgi:Ca2+-binding EF-hand superfamily protein
MRETASEFFDFSDCDDDGEVSSENLWKALSNINTRGVDVTTTMTNDFVLKSDMNGDANLSFIEFDQGVMVGYWERMVTDEGMNPTFDQ